MFIQVVTGTALDADGIRSHLEQRERLLRLSAVGYLGTTSGVTDEGRFVSVTRYESREAGRVNSDRPEQTSWWVETERLVADVDVKDSVAVVSMLAGASAAAGFVQVMRGHALDPARMPEHAATMRAIETRTRTWRPDILGETVAVHDDGSYTHAAYFTSEKEARANEQKLPPKELWPLLSELMAAIQIDEYLDIRDPWFI
jgi:hypothetical protein